MPKLFVATAAVFAAVYAGAVGFLTIEQRSLLYRPGNGPTEPAELGLAGFRVERVGGDDGVQVPVWRHDPAPGRPVVVHFHGNGGGLYTSATRLQRLAAAGYGIAGMAYRGYPGAPGKPSEAAIVADAVALLDRLAGEGVPPGRIVLYGWSLGSAVALQVAARRPVGGLILEAPPTAIVDRAAEIYWWVPVSWLLQDRWLSRDVIGRVQAPMLILHGARDGVVPLAHGERLAALAGDRARLVVLPEARHADIDRWGGLERMIAFLERLPGG